MTKSRRDRGAAGITSALVLLLLAACGGGGGSSKTSAAPGATGTTHAPSETTAAGVTTVAPASSVAAAAGWSVDTSMCADPARAEQPIEGTVKIGATSPLSGSPAAAFSPVKDGFQMYLNDASEKGLLPGYTISVDIRDDQYDPTQTPGVVDGLIGDGVDVIAGVLGTANGLEVRKKLNDECIPQLLALTGSPAWGEAADYPWTTGALVPYNIEAAVYATKLNELVPNAKVALFSINNEFGKAYVDAFQNKADELGLEIVDAQTIEAGNNDPPVTQLGSIADKLPDAVVAIPLGVQCPVFLKALETAKALTPAWTPRVFITNTCASKLFFGLAGPAGEGVYTSSNLLDANDHKNDTVPGVKTFLDAYNAAGLAGDPALTEIGWTTGEALVNILNAALQTGTLSRKSIIEAARTLTYTPSLARPSVQYKMKGVDDGYAFQTLQVLQWSVASQTFTEIGDPISDFES